MQIQLKKRLILVMLSTVVVEIFGSDREISSPKKMMEAKLEEDNFFKVINDVCVQPSPLQCLQEEAEARSAKLEQELKRAQGRLAQEMAEQQEEDNFFKELDDACNEVNEQYRWQEKAKAISAMLELKLKRVQNRLVQEKAKQQKKDNFFKVIDDACNEVNEQYRRQEKAKARSTMLELKRDSQLEAQKQFKAFQQMFIDKGQQAFAQILVQKGFTHEEERASERLCSAALDGNVQIVQDIVRSKFGSRVINSPYMKSTTNPLLGAAGNGHLNIVLYLIANGADRSYRNSREQNFLDVARLSNRSNIVEYFKK